MKENIILSPYTTFQIGGPARYFSIAKNEEDINKAINFAQSKKLPYFILGGGSNLLINDKGFSGLVIKIEGSNFQIKENIIISDAGTLLSNLVAESVKNSLTGLEWAVGIPGTIGGAINVQASAFNKNILESVRNIKKINDVIISAELKLQKGNSQESQKMIQKYIRQRKETQPINYASAGCIFKNPPEKFAGKLIEDCGLKGLTIGQAQVSQKHANFIINLGRARSNDVSQLIKKIKNEVWRKFEIKLEEEIQYLGF